MHLLKQKAGLKIDSVWTKHINFAVLTPVFALQWHSSNQPWDPQLLMPQKDSNQCTKSLLLKLNAFCVRHLVHG